jgi:hypothetical protein
LFGGLELAFCPQYFRRGQMILLVNKVKLLRP